MRVNRRNTKEADSDPGREIHVAAEQESVLLIDDDVDMCEMLMSYLSRHGWSVAMAHTGEAGIRKAGAEDADLIILDVMLPDIDGFEVLRRLHRVSEVPVLLLTARGEEIDRIVGLEMGADDYLPKPFNPRELLARMKAVRRRAVPRETPMAGAARAGDFVVNENEREIRYRNQEILLTDIEFTLLAKLLEHAPEILQREELFKAIFGRSSGPFDRSLDMHISRLRRKLAGLPGFTGAIKTVRSSGYVFVPQASGDRSGGAA